MSWSFQIFSPKSVAAAQAILTELTTQLEILEEESPEIFEKNVCPAMEEPEPVKPKSYTKIFKTRSALDETDPLHIDQTIVTRMKTVKSVTGIDSFHLEESPLGVSILKFFLEKHSPCVLQSDTAWDLGENFLEMLNHLDSIPLESVEPETMDTPEEEPKAEDKLEVLQAQFFRLIERAARDLNARMEAEKAFGKTSPSAQKLLNFILTAKNIDEHHVLKQLKLTEEQLGTLVEELEKTLTNLKKSL